MSPTPLGLVMALISAAPVLCPSASMGDLIQRSAPRGRSHHVAVWTGDAMVIWGGFVGPQERTNTGAVYTPATDSWSPSTTHKAPPPLSPPSAVWTGSEMMAWGGWGKIPECSLTVCPAEFGGRYDPASDSWVRVNSGWGQGHAGHTAVWTGTEMLVWGGYRFASPYEGVGFRYDPGRNSWQDLATAGAPSPRIGHTAIWTGNEMIIWGGHGNSNSLTPYPAGYLNTGARYDPITGTWTALPTRGAPSSRMSHTAVWTGEEMIVWGGSGSSGYLSSGAKYDPAKNAWTPLSTTGAPDARCYHTAVWTGSQMLTWGGSLGETSYNTGAAYDPDLDRWSPLSSTNAPDSREFHTAVWTGREMIVWGGRRRDGWSYSYLNTGGRYDPSTDRWTPIAASSGVVAVR